MQVDTAGSLAQVRQAQQALQALQAQQTLQAAGLQSGAGMPCMPQNAGLHSWQGLSGT
jgi:hypothetical protein